jgi:hypothetical protein
MPLPRKPTSSELGEAAIGYSDGGIREFPFPFLRPAREVSIAMPPEFTTRHAMENS